MGIERHTKLGRHCPESHGEVKPCDNETCCLRYAARFVDRVLRGHAWDELTVLLRDDDDELPLAPDDEELSLAVTTRSTRVGADRRKSGQAGKPPMAQGRPCCVCRGHGWRFFSR